MPSGCGTGQRPSRGLHSLTVSVENRGRARHRGRLASVRLVEPLGGELGSPVHFRRASLPLNTLPICEPARAPRAMWTPRTGPGVTVPIMGTL